MHNRRSIPDTRDALSDAYLRSNATYGDFLRRQNAGGRSGYYDDRQNSAGPARLPLSSERGGMPSWRGPYPHPITPSRGYPLREGRDSYVDNRPPTNSSWRNEPRGFHERPSMAAKPSSESWVQRPVDAQRQIAPPGGFRSNEVWRPGPSEWRKDIPYNGIRMREPEISAEETRKRPFPDDPQEEHYKNSKVMNTAVASNCDDNWRTFSDKNREVAESSRTDDTREDSFHLNSVNSNTIDSTEHAERQVASPPNRILSAEVDGLGSDGRAEKKSSLIIHDANFEDVHMFHLKHGGNVAQRSESWLQQYRKRVESTKINVARAQSRPTLLARTPEEWDKRTAREENLPSRSSCPRPGLLDNPYRSTSERPDNDSFSEKSEVPYSYLSVDQLDYSGSPSSNRGSRTAEFTGQLLEKSIPVREKPNSIPSRSEQIINPDDYVEEFSDDDWNEIAALVSNTSKTPQQEAQYFSKPGTSSDAQVSFFRTEIPSVRPAKVPFESPSKHGRTAPPLQPNIATSDREQWRSYDESDASNWHFR